MIACVPLNIYHIFVCRLQGSNVCFGKVFPLSCTGSDPTLLPGMFCGVPTVLVQTLGTLDATIHTMESVAFVCEVI